MPFPVSVNGVVVLPDVPASDFRKRVIFACLDELEYEHVEITERAGYGIAFHVPLVRMRNPLKWHMQWLWLTTSVSSGTIEVDPAPGRAVRLTYRLSLSRTLRLGIVMSILFFVASPLTDRWVPLVAFAWLVGAPYVFTKLRARRWMRKRIAEAEASVASNVGSATPALGGTPSGR